jgi:hypothetical protein
LAVVTKRRACSSYAQDLGSSLNRLGLDATEFDEVCVLALDRFLEVLAQLEWGGARRWQVEGRAATLIPMPTPLPDLERYKQTPVFDESSLPAGLLRRHTTKARVRGSILVVEGEVIF